MKEESQLSIVEPVEDSTKGAHETQASKVKPGGSRRRTLSTTEGREIARLYAETNTPTSDIRARFGIGESSLYRIVQRQGVPLRGRTSASKAPGRQPAQAPDPRRSRSSSGGGQTASPARSTNATTARRPALTAPTTACT